MRTISIRGMEFRQIYSAHQIQKKIAQLAKLIVDSHPDDKILLVCVLKGASFFATSLMQHISALGKHDVELEYIALRSYAGTRSTGKITCKRWLDPLFRKKLNEYHVYIIEDVVDTGLTFAWLENKFKSEQHTPLSITFLPLFDKSGKYPTSIQIGHAFVIGFGLDLDGWCRGLKALYQKTA